MSATLREAAQQALEALKSVQDHRPNDETNAAVTALRDALAQQEPMRPTFQEMQNAAANLRVMKEMFGDPATSCDIAEDGACEALHADAERYLWVLRHYGEFHGDWTLAAFQRRAQEKGIGPGLDGAIDAAIAAEFSDAAIDAAMGKT